MLAASWLRAASQPLSGKALLTLPADILPCTQTEELSIVEGCLGWRVEEAAQAGPVLQLQLRCGPLYRLKLHLTRADDAWQASLRTLLVPAGAVPCRA